MKNIFSSLIFLLASLASFSQAPSLLWQKALGGSGDDVANSVTRTYDGGYAVAGYSKSNNGNVTGHHGGASISDFWVAKLNSDGTLGWQKSLGGTGEDVANSIIQTRDSGFIVAGSTVSTDGDVKGINPGGLADYWVVKLSDSGAIQWQKCLGGGNYDVAYSIVQTFDGGYVVAGTSNSTDGDVTDNHLSSYDYWVVKLSDTGAIQRKKSLGGTDEDIAYSIVQTSDSGYAVAGYADSDDGDVTGIHTSGNPDYWIVKLNDTLGIQWQHCYGGNDEDKAYSIIQTSDTGYAIAGAGGSEDGDVTGHHSQSLSDYWIVKLNSAGILKWEKSLGGTQDDQAKSIIQTGDGGYVVAGYSNSIERDVSGNIGSYDYWVVQLSDTGAIRWQESLGGTDQDLAYSIVQTADSSWVVAGGTRSIDGDVTGSHDGSTPFINDYWVVKLGTKETGIGPVIPDEETLIIYPNPANNKLVVKADNFQPEILSVYDMNGRKVVEEKYVQQIDVSALTSGIYFMELKGADVLARRMFVKM